MDNLNELDAMIGSAYLNFEAETDLPVIAQSEKYLLYAYGSKELESLGAGASALLLSLATMWHSFPADAADLTVSPHALALGANHILNSDWEPLVAFPFTCDEMRDALAQTKAAAKSGDAQPLLDAVAAAFAIVRAKEANRHKQQGTPPATQLPISD